jgi:hypothetical protein
MSGERPVAAVPPSPVLGAPLGIFGPVVVVTGWWLPERVVTVVPGGVVPVDPGVVPVGPGVVAVVVPPVSVVVVADAKQVGTVMVLSSSVTAPVWTCTRPLRVAPVLSVADASASTVPTKVVEVPKVAELPTCQKTLQA